MAFDPGGADRVLDLTSATELLASLGFLLVPGPPTDRAPAYLLVAVRNKPTLRHFDPQRIELWAQGPAHMTLEWPVDQMTCRYSWGEVDVVDRLGKANRFVSFGGFVSTSHDHDVHAALFRSNAPILGAGGHSGPADPLGVSVAAFFGVVRAAAGNDTRIGDLIQATSPTTLYAAYLERSLASFDSGRLDDALGARLVSVLRQERVRLEREDREEARNGSELVALIAAIPCLATNKEVSNGRAR